MVNIATPWGRPKMLHKLFLDQTLKFVWEEF